MATTQATSDRRWDNNWAQSGAWMCHKCDTSHSWRRGCEPTAPANPTPPSSAKKGRPVTDVVRADRDKVTKFDRCNLCKKAFKRSDAVIRVRDLVAFSEPGTLFHRRCMEGLLADSVDDEPKDREKFERYRKDIADKYGIEAQDD